MQRETRLLRLGRQPPHIAVLHDDGKLCNVPGRSLTPHNFQWRLTGISPGAGAGEGVRSLN